MTIQLERPTEKLLDADPAPLSAPVSPSHADRSLATPPPRETGVGDLGDRADPLNRRIGVGWAVCIAVGWPTAIAALIAIEPAPADPDAPVPLVASLLSSLMLVAIIGAISGALVRRRWAAASSMLAAGIAVVFAVACPASGHHALAPWWFGSLAITGALVIVSATSWRRT